MAWSTVTAPVAGGTVATSTFGTPVSNNMAVLGGAWVDDTAARASTAIWTTTGSAIGNGTLISRYRLAGKTLDWFVSITFGSTTSAGSAAFTFAYPASVTPRNTGGTTTAEYFDSSASNTYLGAAIANASTVQMFQQIAASGQIQSTTFAAPFTWATSDVCAFLLTGLEVA